MGQGHKMIQQCVCPFWGGSVCQIFQSLWDDKVVLEF